MAPPKPPQPATGVRGRVTAAVVWIRQPELGLLGQGLRYAIAGATVAFVSIAGTLSLGEGAGLSYAVAFSCAYAVAVVVHFTLQRYFVWSHHEEYALPLHLQLVRYLPIAAVNYGVVEVAILVLPHALHIPERDVYLGMTVLMTVTSFLLFRTSVFHAQESTDGDG
jgi:putative flippase GtrA